MENILGNEFVDNKGNTYTLAQISEAKVLLVYFSAHWCPPCRGFTPTLAEFYEEVNADGKNVEIVFVSSDKSEDQFKEYLGEMPWKAIPFDAAKLKPSKTHYQVQGIPLLLTVNKTTGALLSGKTRQLVENEGPACLDTLAALYE